MSDEHTQEGQLQRAKRLREQIENLKSGQPIPAAGHTESLREQVEERARQAQVNPAAGRDEDAGS
jgi:cell division protein FtsB